MDKSKKYVFLKSGSIVKLLEKCSFKYHSLTLWEVERIDTGKKW
jgi:hypothetical protein